MKRPRRVTVGRVIASRYSDEQAAERPFVWDERRDGVDTIETTDGEVLELWSEGMQSPPKPGWVILLRDQVADGCSWTLYALPKGAEISKLVQELPVL